VTTLENFTFGDTPTPQAVASFLDEVLSLGEAFDVSPHELSGRARHPPLRGRDDADVPRAGRRAGGDGAVLQRVQIPAAAAVVRDPGKFDAGGRNSCARLLAQSQKRKTWFKIDLRPRRRAIGAPREKMVAALNYLEEQGDLCSRSRACGRGIG
jgi:ATP-dependent DNA helicase RecQ